MSSQQSDVLIFAAHPDDAEIGVGGTIKKLTDSGSSVGIIDFTKGEMGTRDRKSVVQGKSVDLGGRRIIKKKK